MNSNQQYSELGIQKNFLSKIKDNYSSKFSNLSLSSSIQNISHSSDHDGNSEDDTLIHNAFVKFFDSKGESYPEWLGVKVQNQVSRPANTNSNYRSEYQPVFSNYNSNGQGGNQSQYSQNQYSANRYQSQGTYQPQQEPQQVQQAPEATPQRPAYTPRSSSRLQDMYNKSRQQSIPGAGYNTQSYPSGPTRTNSSTTGSRLRERVLNSSPSMNGLNQTTNSNTNAGSSSNSRATWGRK